jgi:hypothetical protein
MPIMRGPIWHNRDFVRLWAAATVSLFGDLIMRTALPFTAILLGRAAVLVSVPAAALLHVLGMPQLYLVGFLIAMLSTIFAVADRSFPPSVVGRDEVLPANAALTASSAVAEFGGFGASGFLVQWLTAPIAVLVGSVTLLWSALFISRIRSPEPPAPPAGPGARPARDA